MSRKTQDWRCWYSRFVLLSSVLIASIQDSAFAQITPDGTLPNNSSVARDGNTFNITGGTTAGSNLFHSFEEFSVPNNGTASFNNAVDIQNIISRVTGSSVSDINGLIKANGTANLFLINPNGIVFGENAQLDIGGSFVGSTADAIGFGENNFFSASSPENSSSLLEVNPSALFFNQVKAASIQSNSVTDVGLNVSGLRVPNGESLLLVGGDINIDGGVLLYAFGGRVELGGLAGTGTVGLDGDGKNLKLSFPEGVDKSNVSLSNGAIVGVIYDDGGSVAVNAQNFEMSGKSLIIAGIDNGLSAEQSRAGNIDVNVKGAINLEDESTIINAVLTEASGQGGNINISASTLLLKDGSRVSAVTFGEGKGGNLTVDAPEVQLIGESEDGRFLSGLSAFALPNSTGDAGDLTIKTETLLVQGGAQVSAATSGKGKGGNVTVDAQEVQLIGESENGQFSSGLFASAEQSSTGDAGNLTIKTSTLLIQDGAAVSTDTSGEGEGGDLRVKTDTLLVKDGAQVSAGTGGDGKGGNLTVNAQDVQLIGTSEDDQSSSRLFTSAQEDSTGDAGNLTVKTNTLLVQDGAQVSAGTFGEGKGGILTVNASDVQLIGSGSGLFTSSAELNTMGGAGDLTIKTNNLLVRDGAVVSASTSGKGNGGNLTVDASDVQLIGSRSGLSAEAKRGSIGDSGDLNIKTSTLLIQDGAQVSAGTGGEGKGGNVTVDASDVQLIGGSKNSQSPSALFASAQLNSTGDAGDLTVKTNSLLIKDGAQVGAGTSGEGKGGNLTVDAQEVQLIGTTKDSQFGSGLFASVQRNSRGNAGDLSINTNKIIVRDGAVVTAGTLGEGKGGNLTVNAQDVQLIGRSEDGQSRSGLFASAQQNSRGDAGDLSINTNTLKLENGAVVSVTGFTTEGTAGELTINADSIRLNNDALLNASTSSNKVDPEKQQATININSQDIIMRRGSSIRTNARNENVIAGNIEIDTDFLIANENSDISADSANSQGGNVRIDAQGIFGTQFRLQFTPQSDITATGASSDLGGTVELNTPEVDPNNGLIELPTIPVDTEVAQGCYSPGYAQSSFAIAGPGGLPPNPKDILTPDTAQIDWVSVKPSNNNRSLPPVTTKPATSAPKRIVEATGATLNAKGQIVLAANPSNFSSNNTFKNNSISCKNKLETEN